MRHADPQEKAAVEILRHSHSLFVLTGAGISAESGIPTFRGKDGLWKNYSATDLATPEAFARDPDLVWEWYYWRQSLIRQAKPNPAHFALVELEKWSAEFLLLTQNVDGLHQRAGSRKILELHGNIFRTRCLDCNRVAAFEPDARTRCPCGGRLRPDIVWFGEPIPHDAWNTSMKFLNDCAAVLICGTSGAVWPAAQIPQIARENGSATIEINLEPTPISSLVDVALLGKAGEILPRLVKAVCGS